MIHFKPSPTDGFAHCTNYEPPDAQVFINSFIVAAAPLPANIWTICHMDKLGRKFFLGIYKWVLLVYCIIVCFKNFLCPSVFSMVGSGLAAFLIWLVQDSTGNLILSCIFGAVTTMGFNALDCLGAELFPTGIRSTAMAIILAAARLGAIVGNLVFGSLVDFACAVPILLVAALLMGMQMTVLITS